MKRSIPVLSILFALTFSLIGCKKEDPNPELKDPIFKDLEKRAADFSKSSEELKLKLKEQREKVFKAEPNTIEAKDLKKELAKMEKQYLNDSQMARYYKIRADRRKFVGRQEYRQAFAKGKEWPDPREYSDYLVNNRLREGSLIWNKRVPKLQDRLSNYEEKRKPAKK